MLAAPSIPATPIGRFYRQLRRLIIGAPIPNAREIHERLTKLKALAVLSSDAISSTAYATEETLLILALAGAGAYHNILPIGIAIAVLLAIVAFSYRQTIFAYPNGGGSYSVTKDNLGTFPALVAATSLLIDYTLTVAVSISAGVAALTSAAPSLIPHAVLLSLVATALLVVGNLRGIRESGSIFAIPTYLFIGGMYALLALGLGAVVFHVGVTPQPVRYPMPPATASLTLFLILRAFASGCTALTGVEAISNGVPAFQAPESRNAARTLTAMALILGSVFLGITALTYHFHLVPTENETILSQLARTLSGHSAFYYYIQATTAGILVLAANTSFADFPRLASILARDRFLPHQFQYRGDRLAFSTGIVVLGVAAGILLVIFKASTNALIPLYAVGVFTAFTLSQTSMTYRWLRKEPPGHRRLSGVLINGTGALATGVVALVIIATKFTEGAWIILIIQPILIWQLLKIHRHYERVREQLRVTPEDAHQRVQGWAHDLAVVVPIASLNQASIRAIDFAEEISRDVTVVHVATTPEDAERMQEKWRCAQVELPLVIIDSPYRELVGPLVNFVEQVHREKSVLVLVVMPEFIPAHLYEVPLHNQTAWRLRTALWTHPDILVTSVPYHLTV